MISSSSDMAILRSKGFGGLLEIFGMDFVDTDSLFQSEILSPIELLRFLLYWMWKRYASQTLISFLSVGCVWLLKEHLW